MIEQKYILTCQQTLLQFKILLGNHSLVLKRPRLSMKVGATMLVDAKTINTIDASIMSLFAAMVAKQRRRTKDQCTALMVALFT